MVCSVEKGTQVRAVCHIGGMFRESVPADSLGVVVTSGGMFDRPEVAFTVRGWIGDDKQVIVEVYPGDVEPA